MEQALFEYRAAKIPNDTGAAPRNLSAKIREKQISLLRHGFLRMVALLVLCHVVFISLNWQNTLLVSAVLCIAGTSVLDVLHSAFKHKLMPDNIRQHFNQNLWIGFFNTLNFSCGLSLALTPLLFPALSLLDIIIFFTLMTITMFSAAILYAIYLPAYYAFAIPLIFGMSYSLWRMAPNDLHLIIVTCPLFLLAASYIASFVNRISIRALTQKLSHQITSQKLFHDNHRKEQERQLTEKRLQYLAYHDELTGLGNRKLMQIRLTNMIALPQYRLGSVAVMMIHIDRLQIINTALGHPTGDRLLQKLAKRLRMVARYINTMIRFSSDQFALILDSNTDPKSLKVFAKVLIRLLSKPCTLDEHELIIGASIGISRFPEHADEVQQLITQADLAMNQAKYCGGNTVQFFDEIMTSISRERLAMESRLRQAIQEKQLEVYYQPKVNLQTNTITSAEALIRWHQKSGSISPAVFIPLAEEMGRIDDIGNFVLEKACAHAVYWLKQGWEIKVSVNIAAIHLLQGGLVNKIKLLLRKNLLPPRLLELEITESQLMDDIEQAILIMQAIRAMGVGLSIDDFGTGYSSLSYIKRLPVDTLKIDRAFISHNHECQIDSAITKAIIAMAQSLDLKVVAEGVERVEQMDQLQEYGCDEAQGFYISKPLPFNRFTMLLAAEFSNNPERL